MNMCDQKKEKQISEQEYKQKAMAHDVSDLPQPDLRKAYHAVEQGVAGAYQKMEDAVAGGYQKIETGVVEGYKKIENGVVEGFAKMTDRIVEKFLTREGETLEEAKKRMNGEAQE